MSKTVRALLAAYLLLLCTSVASATEYYWHFGTTQGVSPDAVARAYVTATWGASQAYYWQSKAETVWVFGVQGKSYDNRVLRVGDSCPQNYTYDAETGQCNAPEPDKCEATKGQSIAHAHKVGDIKDGHFVNPSEPPAAMCAGSCLYSSPATTTDAYRFVSGDPAGIWQNYSYLGTGASCTASTDTPEPSTPADRKPTSSKSNECTNKVEDAEGRVHYSCLATDSATEPGNLKCGTANGELVCTTGKPSPSKKDTQTKTEVTETTASDGSSTTNTTTTTTVTNCTGTNACTSTTTVNNSTSKTNADGTSGGSSSNCTGAGCKNGSKDDTSDEQQDDEEPERTASGDTDCAAALACDGDAIDCAMVRQQKQLRCEVKDQGDFPKHKDEVKGLISGSQFAQEEDGQIEAPSFLNQGSRFLPATCPAAKSFSLQTNGGRTFQLSYEPLCAAASDLGVLFLIGTSVFCAIYVGRAFGGE